MRLDAQLGLLPLSWDTATAARRSKLLVGRALAGPLFHPRGPQRLTLPDTALP